jgi:hypothetical protein
MNIETPAKAGIFLLSHGASGTFFGERTTQ